MSKCDRDRLAPFLSNDLDIEDKLEVLFHLDSCSECWDIVYHAVKAQHPHFYKSTARRAKVPRRALAETEEEKIFEVA